MSLLMFVQVLAYLVYKSAVPALLLGFIVAVFNLEAAPWVMTSVFVWQFFTFVTKVRIVTVPVDRDKDQDD